MERHSNALLFALVLVLACADWFVAPTTAQPGESQVGGPEAVVPAQVPALARLTGETQQTVTLDGVEITLEGTPGQGFELALHNGSAEAQLVRYDVECVQVTGSMVSRIGPIPRVVHRERVEVTVAAGATVRHALEAEVPEAPAVPADAGPFAAFTTTSFHLRRPALDADDATRAGGVDASVLAALRWTNTPAEAG